MHAPADAGPADADYARSLDRRYAWLVFALSFGLMLSDYMSRQVINAVFPQLKAEWQLSDAQLGALVSVVALLVGVMSFPVSLLADRIGRVRSTAAMAIVWGLATVACGLSGNFVQMLFARALVGLGEAGYGSAGGAVLIAVFPPERRSTVIGAFLAAALFGSVLGVGLGGVLADGLGWRWAFVLVGGGGLLLAIAYPMLVREPPRHSPPGSGPGALRALARELFGPRTARWAYLGTGLQMFVQGALVAWLPSYLNRYAGMDTGQAAVVAAGVVLAGGIGMIACGAFADRHALGDPRMALRLPAAFAVLGCVLLALGFSSGAGPAGIALVAIGAFFAGGHAGPIGAVLTSVTRPAIHATVLATGTLANNVLGLAPGPFLTGVLADAQGLRAALQLMPLVGLLAAACFLAASRHYAGELHSREL
jgi:predicted MFS family arabinose efflux permease